MSEEWLNVRKELDEPTVLYTDIMTLAQLNFLRGPLARLVFEVEPEALTEGNIYHSAKENSWKWAMICELEKLSGIGAFAVTMPSIRRLPVGSK